MCFASSIARVSWLAASCNSPCSYAIRAVAIRVFQSLLLESVAVTASVSRPLLIVFICPLEPKVKPNILHLASFCASHARYISFLDQLPYLFLQDLQPLRRNLHDN